MKIAKIEKINYEEKVPVYCLNVNDDNHAFILENGLISHNCEGASAGGTIISARQSRFQAVLPIRGKILNVMKLDFSNKSHLNRFNSNSEIDDIIKALGAGVGQSFDIDKIRYGKVIFACDSDVDGKQINTLLLGIFYKLFRPMIEEGRVYQCLSPLYEVKYMKKGVGEVVEYAVDEKERIEIEKSLKSKKVKYNVSRNKGLGELDSKVFSEYVLDPSNRRLIRVTIEDAKKCDEIINLAIGDRSADDRKDWMLDNTDVIDDLGLYL